MNKLWLMLLSFFSAYSYADTIWIEQESYHTAVVLPVDVVKANAPALTAVIGNQAYVRFGWGDRDYYGASKKSMSKALKALFLAGPSVMEVAGFTEPAQAGDRVVALTVNTQEVQQLLTFIEATFKLNTHQQPVLVRVEPTGFSYYEAIGRYHIFHNCNNWTAEGLQRSGLKVYFQGVFLAGQVMGQLP